MFKEHLAEEQARGKMSHGVGMSMRDVFAAIAEVQEMQEAVKEVIEGGSRTGTSDSRSLSTAGTQGDGGYGDGGLRPRTRESFGARPLSRDSFGRPYSRESVMSPPRSSDDDDD